MQYADKFIKQDLFLYDEVVDIAKSEKVEAVVSDQHDIMAPLVAYIAENLGLAGNKYETLVSYCNKNEFRSNCDKLGIPSPVLTHKGQRLGPIIIKDDNLALLKKDIEHIKQILHISVRGDDGVVRDICWQ